MITDYQSFDSSVSPTEFGVSEDFCRAGTFATGDTFTGTAISSGTLASAAALGGVATLSGAATTDDSGYQIQSAACFAVTANKPILFKTRVSLSDATESDLWAGLMPIDTSIIASEPTDLIAFKKADGGTTISACVRVASGTTTAQAISSTLFTAVADTYNILGIAVYPGPAGAADTTSRVDFSINGVVVHRFTGALPAASVVLAASLAFQSGTATGTISAKCDYIEAIQKR